MTQQPEPARAARAWAPLVACLAASLCGLLSPGLAWASLPDRADLTTVSLEARVLPELPSGLQTAVLEETEHAACGAFCAEPLRLELAPSPISARSRFFSLQLDESASSSRCIEGNDLLGSGVFGGRGALGICEYAQDRPTFYVDPTGHQSVDPNAPPDDVVSSDTILRDAKQAVQTIEKSNPQLARAESEAARQTTEPVVVDEDHGPLGNLIEGAAKRLSESWLGQKVGQTLDYLNDKLEAASKKMGRAASGYVHGNAAEQDPVVRESRANAARALEDADARRIVQRNIGKGAEDVAADIAREGAERSTREGLPVAVAGVAGRGLRGLGGVVDDTPLVFRKDAAILAKEHATLLHNEYATWVLGPNARQRTFKTPWSASRGLGTRRFDGFDRATGTYFEANTTPWSQMTQEQLSRKLNQVGSDWTLMQTNRNVNRVVWFGTEELPITGLGGQLKQALEKAEIPYWVIRP